MKYDVIAVSDLHLGHSGWQCVFDFHDFIDNFVSEYGTRYFVFLGDIIDLWRCQNEKVLLQSMEIFHKLVHLKLNDIIGEIHYVRGNHDYTINDYLAELDVEEQEFVNNHPDHSKSIEKHIFFEDEFVKEFNDSTYRFIHGHQLEYGGILTKPSYESTCTAFCGSGKFSGWTMSKVYDIAKSIVKFKGSPLTLKMRIRNRGLQRKVLKYLTKPPDERKEGMKFLKSLLDTISSDYDVWQIYNPINDSDAEIAIRDIAHEFIGLQDGEKLVFGHTHQGGCGTTIANTGCWTDKKRKGVRGILISDDEWKPLHWTNSNV